MARIRTIKPSFFTSHDITQLSLSARLTFIGLWTYADDGGRAVDDARLVKAALWPLDDKHTAARVEADLKAIAKAGLIERYQSENRSYLRICAWQHQRINRPMPSKIPPAPSEPGGTLTEHSVSPHGARTDDSPQEGNKEGNKEGRKTSSSSSTDDDDLRVRSAVNAIANRDLERRTHEQPGQPVRDRRSWLTAARQRRSEDHADQLAALARNDPTLTVEQLVDLVDPKPAVTDRYARQPHCDECEGRGVVELADGTCRQCTHGKTAANG